MRVDHTLFRIACLQGIKRAAQLLPRLIHACSVRCFNRCISGDPTWLFLLVWSDYFPQAADLRNELLFFGPFLLKSGEFFLQSSNLVVNDANTLILADAQITV